jgi:hypothetical protein
VSQTASIRSAAQRNDDSGIELDDVFFFMLACLLVVTATAPQKEIRGISSVTSFFLTFDTGYSKFGMRKRLDNSERFLSSKTGTSKVGLGEERRVLVCNTAKQRRRLWKLEASKQAKEML